MRNLFCFSLFLIAFVSLASAQFAITNGDDVDKLKNGTLYVVMKDPASSKASEYVEVYKNTWKFSKLEFIRQTDITKHYGEGKYFISLSLEDYSTYSGVRYQYSNTHLYLELWTPSTKYLSGNRKKEPALRERDQLARVDLFPAFEALKDPELIFNSDYDGGGYIRNWGPGFLKSYLLTIQHGFTNQLKIKLGESFKKADKLAILANTTLYIPDYVLIKFNMASGDETKRHDESDITEDYGFKTQFLPTKELDAKIRTDKKGFYYLLYVKSSAWKFVSVVYSLTGEVIYSEFSSASYNLKSGDLKSIRKAVEKG